ncbi:MAG: NAD(P)/FAD-dependent oxidoreductase [Bacteroidota bacterium]
MEEIEVCIVGGGLAGLTAALCLAKARIPVLLLEKNSYPNHKVCGEYVSNEVRPLLEHLGLDINALGVKAIDTLVLSDSNGKCLEAQLPLGGFGISRFALDQALFERAKALGVVFRFETVLEISHKQNGAILRTSKGEYNAKVVIGAFGKRANLDKSMHRPFIQQKSPWLGVKCHYDYPDFPENHVALHTFPGGYGGLSKTEEGAVNFCYLANYSSFKAYSNIADYNTSVVSSNPILKEFLNSATPRFERPLSIAQIAFARKEAVENHILMCGDSAGLIHPLCGNGMAMAIHAAKLAADCIVQFFTGPKYDRSHMERQYQDLWKQHFSSRLYYGRQIQALLLRPNITKWTFSIIANHKKIVQAIVQRTHGKPILV